MGFWFPVGFLVSWFGFLISFDGDGAWLCCWVWGCVLDCLCVLLVWLVLDCCRFA